MEAAARMHPLQARAAAQRMVRAAEVQLEAAAHAARGTLMRAAVELAVATQLHHPNIVQVSE